MSDELVARQKDAEAEAARLYEEKTRLEQQLKDAIGAQDFPRAQEIKDQLPQVTADYAMARATADATAKVLADLAEEQAARQREYQIEAQRAQAREQAARAYEAEQAAEARLRRHLADVEPGLNAVRQSLMAAVAAERDVDQARQAAHQARITLGEAQPGDRTAGANQATARIEASRLLSALYAGRQVW